jgi:pilus assembly protein Flp/PilA
VFLKFGEGMMLNTLLLRLQFRLRDFLDKEEGQDLVEYALVVALIAFGATTAMRGLSNEIKTAFNSISSNLGSAL